MSGNSPEASGPKHAKATKAGPARGFAKSVAEDLATRTNATIAGLLVLVGVTGLAGGFEEASPAYVLATAPGEANPLASPVAVEAGPLKMEIRNTYMRKHKRVVEMQVENTSPRPIPWTRFKFAFELLDSTAGKDQQPKTYRKVVRLGGDEAAEDATFGSIVSMNPGVPMDIALVFEDGVDSQQPGDAERGDTMVISKLEYKASILDGAVSWLPYERIAEVKLT